MGLWKRNPIVVGLLSQLLASSVPIRDVHLHGEHLGEKCTNAFAGTIIVLSIDWSEFVVIRTQLLTNNRAARVFP